MARRWRPLVVVLALVAPATPLHAQTLTDALSFLLTNRSIPTDDFVRDRQAALVARDTIAGLVTRELGTLPISASSGGFTYRLNPSLGVVARSTTNFGPFYSDRSVTVGARQWSFGLAYNQAVFTRLDGMDLRDGHLVSTASRLRDDPAPFDSETITLAIRTDTTTLISTVGVNDRLDLGVALPMVRVELHGARVDTYRGFVSTQATVAGESRGIGDVMVRAKYNFYRTDAVGGAVGADVGLPTGQAENLLGLGHATVTPRMIGSFEGDRLSLHGNVGVLLGNDRPELDYRGAVTYVALPRLTAIAEIAGHQRRGIGPLSYTATAHPTLANVETLRLTSTGETSERVVAIAGFKWNVLRSLLFNAQVLRPLTSSGLYAAWVPSVTVDYSFER